MPGSVDEAIANYLSRLDSPAKQEQHRREVNGAGPDAFVRNLTHSELRAIVRWAMIDGRKGKYPT